MLDLKYIRENLDEINDALKKKNASLDLDTLLELDDKRKSLQLQIDNLRAQKNQESKIIVALSGEEKQSKILEMKSVTEKQNLLEKDFESVNLQLTKLLNKIPNIPDKDVPVGVDEKSNVVLRQVGRKPEFDFESKSYLEIAENLDIIDVKRAVKISGSRFGYLKGAAALLEFALVQYTLQTLTNEKIIKKIAKSVNSNLSSNPFVPVVPPQMIKEEPYWKMARLDLDQKEERYYIPKDELYLIGSAEHSMGPMFMDENIDEKELPMRYLGFSTSFRREAGSYGLDTKGILRVHQFDKLEMEIFCTPENSRHEFDFAVACQEYLVNSLKLPYQVIFISTGDMGWPDSRQHDIEVWIPSENKYRETHTADLMTNYQSRRLNTRVRSKEGDLEFVHMVDATAFAIGRILAAIIENYQQKDGSILVPKVLQPFLPFKKIKGKWGMNR